MYPFYYIEYGIAQIGALQIWRNSLADPVQRGRPVSRSPGARRGPEPARDVPGGGCPAQFDAGLIGELVELVEDQIEKIRAEVPARA